MREWVLFFLLVLCGLLFCSTASGFVREKTEIGKALWWKKQPIEFTMHANGLGDTFSKNPKAGLAGSEFAAITSSFLAWNSIQCDGSPIGLTFQSRGKSATAKAGFNKDCTSCNSNLVVFVRERSNWRFNQNQLAVTTTIFNTNTGEIVDADIEVNAVDFQFSTQTTDSFNMRWDLQSVLTHEVGHFIGLAHSEVKEATMSVTGREKDTSLRTLHSDDIAGACTIYPPKLKAEKIPTYTQSESNRGFGCDLVTGTQLGWGILLLLGVWCTRRKRRFESGGRL